MIGFLISILFFSVLIFITKEVSKAPKSFFEYASQDLTETEKTLIELEREILK